MKNYIEFHSMSFDKRQFIDALEQSLDAQRLPSERDAVYGTMVYRHVRSFIHYVNGRIVDVLKSQNVHDPEYAAAYSFFSNDITTHALRSSPDTSQCGA